MSLEKSPAFCKNLHEVIPTWVERGFINTSTAGMLLQCYPIPESKSKFISLLTIFGSILIGLGVMLFVASNWQYLGSFAKLAIIVGAMAASNLGGMYFSKGDNPRSAQALYLLGGLIYGAGIWLVSQIYQLDLDWSLGLTLWSIGLIPMALLLRSVPLGILNSVIMLLWTFSHHGLVEAVVVLSLAIILSYTMRSRMCLTLALLQGPMLCNSYSFWGITDGAYLLSTMVCAASLFSWYLFHKEKQSLFAAPYLYVSLLTGLPALLSVTGSGFWSWSPSANAQTAVFQLIAAVASSVYVGLTTRKFIPELSVYTIATLLMATISVLGIKEPIMVFSSNIVYFSTVIALIYFGARRLESAAMVNIGVVFFALGVFFRYCDTFFQMLDKSFFFLLGGLVLLVGGYMLEKQRRSLLRGIAQ
jgi:uncharacterized membrane protein